MFHAAHMEAHRHTEALFSKARRQFARFDNKLLDKDIKKLQKEVEDKFRKEISRYKNYVFEDGTIVFNLFISKVVELAEEAGQNALQKNIDLIKMKVQPVL